MQKIRFSSIYFGQVMAPQITGLRIHGVEYSVSMSPIDRRHIERICPHRWRWVTYKSYKSAYRQGCIQGLKCIGGLQLYREPGSTQKHWEFLSLKSDRVCLKLKYARVRLRLRRSRQVYPCPGVPLISVCPLKILVLKPCILSKMVHCTTSCTKYVVFTLCHTKSNIYSEFVFYFYDEK